MAAKKSATATATAKRTRGQVNLSGADYDPSVDGQVDFEGSRSKYDQELDKIAAGAVRVYGDKKAVANLKSRAFGHVHLVIGKTKSGNWAVQADADQSKAFVKRTRAKKATPATDSAE